MVFLECPFTEDIIWSEYVFLHLEFPFQLSRTKNLNISINHKRLIDRMIELKGFVFGLENE